MTRVVDLVGSRAIDQGATLTVPVAIVGNYSTATWAGGIYRGNGGAPLAEFSFEVPSYNNLTGYTSITATMDGTLTELLSPDELDLRYVIRAALPGFDPVRAQQGRCVVNGMTISRPDDTGLGRLTTVEQSIVAIQAAIAQLQADVTALQEGG